ncbi:MAG: adenylate/guanylate cyclase domain-containing protein [Pseudomonadota bacterium]|nr:adenylate/guanylate cyclase domain-containing protein [Pseudomonadota bacterium]
MAWNEERARKRITKFTGEVPEGSIAVQSFAEYAAERRTKATSGEILMEKAGQIEIPLNRAVETHGAHVYANLMDFNSVLEDVGRETETSHKRALEFLNAHYSACDVLADQFGLQRVDFHGSRLHAVVLSPEGSGKEAERIGIAIAFAAAFRRLVATLGQSYPEFRTRVRIGIDSGPAVAINDGTRSDAEPLFVGSAANHAAKRADGDDEGIFFTDRAERARENGSLLNVGPLNSIVEREIMVKYDADTNAVNARAVSVNDAYRQVEARLAKSDYRPHASKPAFAFHHKEPPLSTIAYRDHPPSNAIRMEMSSLFADIDGFTAYIDNAIATGGIARAVANLFVIRRELTAVLQDDFGGRKVRFIGDCLHGIMAEGTARETDNTATIDESILAMGAMRSSFDLCRSMLAGIGSLGIAIGTDFGSTPICRIGLRGEASVRIATSRATCNSESEQRRCNGTESSIGQQAHAAARVSIRRAFGHDRKLEHLDYRTAQMMLGLVPSETADAVAVEPARAHGLSNQPNRSHHS